MRLKSIGCIIASTRLAKDGMKAMTFIRNGHKPALSSTLAMPSFVFPVVCTPTSTIGCVQETPT